MPAVRSPPFYNRAPWNLLIGASLLNVLLCALALATTPWLLLIPIFGWIYLTSYRDLVRRSQLKKKGYFAGSMYRGYWIYEEQRGYSTEALLLSVENTEPGHWELFIPDDAQWRRTVPGWALDRRKEIAGRIAEGWKAKDIHFPKDLDGA